MSDLTTAIRLKGLYCKHCSEPLTTTAISEGEAREILDMLKGAFIDAIKPLGEYGIKKRDIIKAFQEVE